METELERLVVRMSGEAGEYMKMLSDAQQSVQDTASQVQQSADRIEGISSSIRGFAGTAASALASLGATNWLRKAFGEFTGAEDAIVRLSATLKVNKRDVQTLLPSYTEFASSIQRQTIISDESVLSLLRQAETFKLTGSSAISASEKAIALSASITGSAQSSEQYMRVAAMMEKGNFKQAFQMRRMLGPLRETKDLTEFTAKAQEMMASGMEIARAEAQTSSGTIKTLNNAYSDLMEEFGKVVADGIKPVVEGLRELVAWFQSLSPEAKTTIVILAGLVAGFLALGPAVAVIGLIAGTVFNPIVIAIGLVGVAVALFINQVGGVSEAWDMVREGASIAWDWITGRVNEFLAFIKPVTDALVSFWNTAWGMIQEGAIASWEFLTGLWDDFATVVGDIFDGIGVNASAVWTWIRDTIRDAILFAEFTLKNFGQVAEHVWTLTKLGAVSLFNTILFFFTDQVPAFLAWFGENWATVIIDVFNFTETVFSNLGENIWSIFKNLPGLIAGTTDWSEVWTPLTEGFEATTKALVVPERVMGELETQLAKQAAAQGLALGEDFEAFRQGKIQEFAQDTEAAMPENQKKEMENEAQKTGAEIGSAMGKGLNKEVKRLDAVLFGSAEALERVEAFEAMMRGAGTDGAAQGKAGPIAVEAVEAGGAEAEDREDRQEELLSSIRDGINELVKKPTMEVEPAAIA